LRTGTAGQAEAPLRAELLAEQLGVRVLVDAMTMHPTDATVQSQGCRALGYCAQESRETLGL
jgi:hypothetical protein